MLNLTSAAQAQSAYDAAIKSPCPDWRAVAELFRAAMHAGRAKRTTKPAAARGELPDYNVDHVKLLRRSPRVPGSPEFLASLATAERSRQQCNAGTLAGLIREFEGTKQWRRLAESTKKEYRRVFKFWDGEYGTCPYPALEDKAFRNDIRKWHDKFSETKPREADNRVTILARVLSWAAKDGPLHVNVLDGFERAYASDRSDIIWYPSGRGRLVG